VPSPARRKPGEVFEETDEESDAAAEHQADEEDAAPAGDEKSKLLWRHHKLGNFEGNARTWRPPPSALSPAYTGPTGFATTRAIPSAGAVFLRFVSKHLLTKIAAVSTSYARAVRKRARVRDYEWTDILNFVLVQTTHTHAH
jgi:hypothetical protein